jgi:hypothetical protein
LRTTWWNFYSYCRLSHQLFICAQVVQLCHQRALQIPKRMPSVRAFFRQQRGPQFYITSFADSARSTFASRC